MYLNTEAPETEEYISQDGFDLTSLKPLKIKIFNPTTDTENTYSARDFAIIDSNGEDFRINFSAIINFDGLAASNVTEDGKDVILEFEEGSVIGDIDSAAADVTSATMMLQSIMDHADSYETPEQMVMELYETFKLASSIPLIYLEMIVSQIIRDSQHPSKPYRLGSMNDDPKFVGIKRVAALENPTRGIMFERISDVLINNVIDGDESNTKRMGSDLEDLFRL